MKEQFINCKNHAALARVEKGIINLLGKVGDNIIVKRKGKDSYTRKLVLPGTKKNEAALRKQYLRTAGLNDLASSINDIVWEAFDKFPEPGFYHNVLSRFRNAPADTRIALLHSLLEMEINPKFPLERFKLPLMKVEELKNKIVVSLSVKTHPENKKVMDSTCYFFDLLLIRWQQDSERPFVKRQYSEWIELKGPKPLFEFDFPVNKKTEQWLLLFNLQFGRNYVSSYYQAEIGIRVVKAGSYNKADKDWLAQVTPIENKIAIKPKVRPEPPRVKPKKLL